MHAQLVVQVGEDVVGLLLYCLLGEQQLRVYEPGRSLPAVRPEPRRKPVSAAAEGSYLDV